MIALSLLSLLLATATLATPSRRQTSSCLVSSSAFSNLPSSFTPIKSSPGFTTLGVMIQNYECNFDGKVLATTGAGALFDISCLSGQAEFSNIQNDAYNIWSTFSGSDPSDPTITQQLNQKFQIGFLGTQSFVTPDQGGSGPFSVINFTQGSTSFGWTNANAGVNSNLNAAYSQQGMIDVPSTDSSADIDWQQLRKTSGNLPNTLYRLNTVQGASADSSCDPSYPLDSAKYTAKFVFV